MFGEPRPPGQIYRVKGKTGKAIHHFKVVHRVAFSFSWHRELFHINQGLTNLFLDEYRLDDAQVHVERTIKHTSWVM